MFGLTVSWELIQPTKLLILKMPNDYKAKKFELN